MGGFGCKGKLVDRDRGPAAAGRAGPCGLLRGGPARAPRHRLTVSGSPVYLKAATTGSTHFPTGTVGYRDPGSPQPNNSNIGPTDALRLPIWP